MLEEKEKKENEKRSKYDEREKQREEEERKQEEIRKQLEEEQRKKEQEEYDKWKVIKFNTCNEKGYDQRRGSRYRRSR
jgi:hypothetical protein